MLHTTIVIVLYLHLLRILSVQLYKNFFFLNNNAQNYDNNKSYFIILN